MNIAPTDIAVFSRDRRPILVIEVEKGVHYATAEMAAQLRRGFIRHGLLPNVPFFMVATPIQMFLWHGDALPDAHPEYSAGTQPILESYAGSRAHREQPFRYGASEIVFFFWIADIASGVRRLSSDSELDRMLLESGLYEQIKGGSADFDVPL